jgi:hypothetical protein
MRLLDDVFWEETKGILIQWLDFHKFYMENGMSQACKLSFSKLLLVGMQLPEIYKTKFDVAGVGKIIWAFILR